MNYLSKAEYIFEKYAASLSQGKKIVKGIEAVRAGLFDGIMNVNKKTKAVAAVAEQKALQIKQKAEAVAKAAQDEAMRANIEKQVNQIVNKKLKSKNITTPKTTSESKVVWKNKKNISPKPAIDESIVDEGTWDKLVQHLSNNSGYYLAGGGGVGLGALLNSGSDRA